MGNGSSGPSSRELTAIGSTPIPGSKYQVAGVGCSRGMVLERGRTMRYSVRFYQTDLKTGKETLVITRKFSDREKALAALHAWGEESAEYIRHAEMRNW